MICLSTSEGITEGAMFEGQKALDSLIKSNVA